MVVIDLEDVKIILRFSNTLFRRFFIAGGLVIIYNAVIAFSRLTLQPTVKSEDIAP